MPKKRVLFVNEFSQLATGFSTIGNEVMKRLYATDKYVLAEQASYCSQDDPRIDNVPWEVFPTIPYRSDTKGIELYNSIRTAQFGTVKFNDHLLAFKPDIIISIRDNWMDAHIAHTPLRPYFKWCYQPTIDGEPQRKDWLFDYKNADVLTTYTKWAKNILERDGFKVRDVTMPGVDENVFKPSENKRQLKIDMGINPDWFIIQTVMRNQGRKFFPQLLKIFSEFIKICIDNGQMQLANKCYLHFHTSLEDVGWDIVDEIQKYGLGHKVLLTYVCQETGRHYLSFYKGKRGFSRFGEKLSSITPNTSIGISRENLAGIHQIADLYIQLSCAEGAGMPHIDAKACGVPTMGMPYSATGELVSDNNGGIPLKISSFFQESINETSQLRALPDIKYAAKAIYEFFMKSDDYRRKLGEEARSWVLQNATWDICAKKWEKIIDSLDCPDQSQTWFSPPNIFIPKTDNLPLHLPNELFILWAYQNILGRPWILDYTTLTRLQNDLAYGHRVINNNGQPQGIAYTKQTLVDELKILCEQLNNFDRQRYNITVGGSKNDEIKYGRY